MIDGLFKKRIDPLWELLAKPVSRVTTANAVTLAGFLLVAISCAAFLYHQSPLWFGVSLALAFSADSMDGAVARLRGESSHFGGYLDAMVDRYQELLVFITIAHFADAWAAAFLAFSGAFATSYAKARTAIEVPVSNDDWPDFFERQERIIFLCLLLVGAPIFSSARFPVSDILNGGLWLLAVISHGTALQRFGRARRILRAADGINKGASADGLQQQQAEPQQGHLT
jgi:phosphatidylglycerophosphate synthase